MKTSIYDLTINDINGNVINLSDYKGKVLLIVNTASKCGFTPQYRGLEDLYQRYKDQGFEVLAIPCNQFNGQEPGSACEIKKFCSEKYGITFRIGAKVKVNGPDADDLYKYLKSHKRGFLGFSLIKWNFTKFLVNKNGKVVARYSPLVAPEKLSRKIQKLLK